MNEKQINFYTHVTSEMIPGGVHSIVYESGNKGVEFTEEALKKFAELIVRECADVAADRDALDIYEEIREHFGVGE